MKTFKKITALVLTLVIGFSVCIPFAKAEESEPKNFKEYREYLEAEGYPAISTEQFGKGMKALRFFSGRGFTEPKYFSFKADELATELCDYILAESGLDIVKICTTMPESSSSIAFVMDTFRIDTVALRNEILKMREEQIAKGNPKVGSLLRFFAAFLSVITECEAYCVPFEGSKDCYEIRIKVKLRDGAEDDVSSEIIINTKTGLVYSKDGDGILSTGYNFDASQMLVYTLVDVWMRDFGFTFLYDLFSYTTPFFFYETRRIKFDYDGLEWMVQMWKGNYLVSNGAEIGIYTRKPGSIGTYYDCANDEQMMNMSMKLYHGKDLLFERPEQLHWWLTGFQIDDRLYPAETLKLDYTIEMKDKEMLNAFCKAIDKHYRNDIKYSVDGLTVNVIW